LKQLFIFPVSFPYYKAAENTFLEHEVIILLKYFPEIIIFPSVALGRKQEIDNKIKIDLSLANYISLKRHKLIESALALLTPILYKEIFNNYKQQDFNNIKRIIRFTSYALIVKKWFKNYLTDHDINNENILLYTYWCTSTTLGLGLMKKRYKNIKLISRAHGIDLYEERGPIFYRRRTLELLDAFFLISNDALNYTTKKYPESIKKYKVSGLGVKSAGFVCHHSNDNVFRIVSCSYVDENKRVNLLLESIIELCQSNPEQIIQWDHFGDGILFNELKSLVNKVTLNNIKITLHGWIDNELLMQYYKENCVDLFISLSSSEGRPVSMQEAQSCGIPILATAVGGVSEIVIPEVGILLNQNPTPIEIAEGILFFIINPDKAKTMREESIKNWQMNFNAEINFENFAKELKMLSDKI